MPDDFSDAEEFVSLLDLFRYHTDGLRVILLILLLSTLLIPLFHKWRLGAVLPFLFIGLLIGESGLKLISDSDLNKEISEYGVVSFLFLIGLEITPKDLWQSKRYLLGLGLLEVCLASTLFTLGMHWLFHLGFVQSFVLGLGASLSSTAFALGWINEHKLMKTEPGKAALNVLIFQDVMIVVMIALLEFLYQTRHEPSPQALNFTLSALKFLGAGLGIVLFFRYVFTRFMRVVVGTGSSELFTILTLLIVFGAAEVAKLLGLSLPLGSFVAGFLLANSPFRHTFESHIRPFKTLLLGFFFIMIGIEVDLHLLFSRPLEVIGILLLFMGVKALILFFLGRYFRLKTRESLLYSVLLTQGGEFAFVLFSETSYAELVDPEALRLVMLGIALSLFLSPILVTLVHQLLRSRALSKHENTQIFLTRDGEPPVLVIGAGRFGRALGQLLKRSGLEVILIDHRLDQVHAARTRGLDSRYGSASDFGALESMGASDAQAIIMAQSQNTLEQTKLIRERFPDIPLFARARDHETALKLKRLKLAGVEEEVYESALELGAKILRTLDKKEPEVKSLIQDFKAQD